MKKALLPLLLALSLLAGCARQEPPAAPAPAAGPVSVPEAPGAAVQTAAPEPSPPPRWEELSVVRSMALQYADQFSVDYLDNGCKLLTISGTGRCLTVPEGAEVPEGVPEDVTVLRQPLDNIYLAATSAMDLFRALDAVDSIRFSSLDAKGWYIPEAVEALERGDMVYAGKYSAPDYEAIVDGGCDLAIESTMIYHNPAVKEQLERFGIPVLVERSSYEPHPLGRMEWIKLYAALLDREEEAEALFDGRMEALAPILDQPGTGKAVAFFYVTSNGAVNVRKSGDYIAKSIALAGGTYVFDGLEEGDDNALATMTMQMEAFYDGAREADVLIYNSSIDAELTTVDQLLQKSALLSDFKAVQTGQVYCTGKNLFQESWGLGAMIEDLHAILTEEEPALRYLYKLTGPR